MFHFWRKGKEKTELSKLVPAGGSAKNIAVVLDDKKMSSELVRLACLMAKAAGSKVYLIYIIEVPLTLPLAATITKEFEIARELIAHGLMIAEEEECDVAAEIVQARKAGLAIVEEVRNKGCFLLLLGLVRGSKTYLARRDLIPFVFANVSCRVLLVQDVLK